MWPFNRRKKSTSPTLESETTTPEEAMRLTGMSEEELTRRFMLDLIRQGKNPLKGMPKEMLKACERDYPDIVDLARKKFGKG